MATISASPAVTTDLLTGTRQASLPGLPLRAPGEWLRKGAPAIGEVTDRPGRRLQPVAQLLQDRAVRLLLLMAGVFCVALAVSAVAGGPATGTAAPRAAAAGPVETAAYPAYTVTSGDTLWSIAQQVNPEADPRAGVLQLRVLNNLAPQDTLKVGDVLLLPAN